MLALKIFSPTVACFLFLLTCHQGTREMESQKNKDRRASNDTLYILGPDNTSISQPIDPKLSEPQKYKFLEIEITKLINPKKHPVIFEVHYQVEKRDKIFLGTFGLFPNDNPGKFIVATQGKLTTGGKLILTLILPEKIANDQLQVTVKKISFKKD
jgi:hypothetical protein